MAEVWIGTEALVALLSVNKSTVSRAIAAKKYTTREVQGGRGGKGGIRYEVLLSSLPKESQEKYLAEQTKDLLAKLDNPQIPGDIPNSNTLAIGNGPQSGEDCIPTPERGNDQNQIGETTEKRNALVLLPKADLTDKQRDRERARKRIMKFVEEFPGTLDAALKHLNGGYESGDLPTAMVWAMNHANDRLNAERAGHLSPSTVKKWKAKKGDLTPKKSRERNMAVQPWHRAAIELRKRPQGSTLRWIEDELRLAMGKDAPSYDQLRHFFTEKYSQGDQLAGRWSGMKLRSKQFYRERSTTGLEPAQEVHADGICTKFTAPHPVTGDYVTYEIWDYHDLATRYVTPFGIGLSESFEVIARGLENFIRDLGVPAILQTDSTKIVKNSEKFKNNPATAISDRAGITIVHPPTVGNAQDNGVPENWHRWLNAESKDLATYQGKDMDPLTYKRVRKITQDMVKAQSKGEMEQYHKLKREAERTGKGLVFGSYEEALHWLEEKRKKWNAKPHRSLKKVRDGETGRMRHQTPDEALAEWRKAGWEGVMLSENEMIDLFRPHVIKTVRRGTLTPYGKMRYRHLELDHWEGKELVVAYDIMDWSAVVVKTLKGELVCVAKWEESITHRPTTAYEDAQEKRAMARIKRKENQIQTIKDQSGLLLEGTAGDVIPLKLTDLMPVSFEVEEPETVSLRELIPQADEEQEETVMDYQQTLTLLYGGKGEDDDDDREAAAE